MKKINLLIIGAGRSGTTSLYQYMKDNPEICFSEIKEVHFFSLKDLYTRGTEYFHSYFQHYKNQKILATADTYLLISKKAPKRVFSYNPEMKIVVVLRDPVDRAYSSFHYAINNGYEKNKISFIESLKQEEERLKSKDIILLNNLCHFYGSLYYKHISYWREYFPKENFLVVSSSDLKNNLQDTLHQLSGFLNIPVINKISDPKEVNKAASVRSKSLQQFLLNRNHPLRSILRPVIKPLKYIINRSGIIDLIYSINKTEKDYNPISHEERNAASLYFEDDLKFLKSEYNISFSND